MFLPGKIMRNINSTITRIFYNNNVSNNNNIAYYWRLDAIDLIVNYYCYYQHYRNVRSVLSTLLRLDTSATAQLLFVLFPETVSHGEEVPTPLLVHVPHVRLLPRVLRVGFID